MKRCWFTHLMIRRRRCTFDSSFYCVTENLLTLYSTLYWQRSWRVMQEIDTVRREEIICCRLCADIDGSYTSCCCVASLHYNYELCRYALSTRRSTHQSTFSRSTLQSTQKSTKIDTNRSRQRNNWEPYVKGTLEKG
jgi:hypothetical protein